MAMSDITRFSHVEMDGSPVRAPLGLQRVKAAALRLFGGELTAMQAERLTPGRALSLLPPSARRFAQRIAEAGCLKTSSNYVAQ
jgi:hypothetical protein